MHQVASDHQFRGSGVTAIVKLRRMLHRQGSRLEESVAAIKTLMELQRIKMEQ
jgi:hypothetical protein